MFHYISPNSFKTVHQVSSVELLLLGSFPNPGFPSEGVGFCSILGIHSLPLSVTPDHKHSVNNLLSPELRENSLASCLQNGIASLRLLRARMKDKLFHFYGYRSLILW